MPGGQRGCRGWAKAADPEAAPVVPAAVPAGVSARPAERDTAEHEEPAPALRESAAALLAGAPKGAGPCQTVVEHGKWRHRKPAVELLEGSIGTHSSPAAQRTKSKAK